MQIKHAREIEFSVIIFISKSICSLSQMGGVRAHVVDDNTLVRIFFDGIENCFSYFLRVCFRSVLSPNWVYKRVKSGFVYVRGFLIPYVRCYNNCVVVLFVLKIFSYEL